MKQESIGRHSVPPHGTQRVSIKSAALLISLHLPHFRTHIQILEKSFGFTTDRDQMWMTTLTSELCSNPHSYPPFVSSPLNQRTHKYKASHIQRNRLVQSTNIVYADIIMKCRTSATENHLQYNVLPSLFYSFNNITTE